MYGEAKKLYLIEAILRIDNNEVLTEIETLIAKGKSAKSLKKGFNEFAGMLSNSEINELEQAVNEGCENINLDDWK